MSGGDRVRGKGEFVGGDAGGGGVRKPSRVGTRSKIEFAARPVQLRQRIFGTPDTHVGQKEVAVSTVKPRVTLRPGANPANAPLVNLETYDPDAIIELLRSFREQDTEDQRRTLEFLIEALNEGRSEGFKTFPDE